MSEQNNKSNSKAHNKVELNENAINASMHSETSFSANNHEKIYEVTLIF